MADYSMANRNIAFALGRRQAHMFRYTVWSLLRDPPVEIRRPFVRPQLQNHLPALCAGRDLKERFVSRRSLLSGGDKRKIQGVNKIEI